ncbi:serine protease inhibitor 27A isoform X2 [Plutella xylostella]|uniref:serine protease inhibitor 27A isoform X2 n=1 Tax=Plutella xylostella TaxID=51655 RepID=UPI002032F5C4|nr:serine protease inhibitor 27A isoform X2 [Plutella xylostella]
MNIIIPNSATGFARIMDNLQELHKEMGFLRERLVDVNLPKFQFADVTSYRQILSELGIQEAFGATASFPGVSRGQQLNGRWKLSTVLQKVGIEVNEFGPNSRYKSDETSDTSAIGAVLEVIANRPFFFFVEYEPLRQVLLAGRLADPAPPPVRVPVPLTLPWN